MKFKNWIALFSQTGQEIIDISNQVDRVPDLIISNNHPSNVINILKGVEYRWLISSKESKTLDILDEVVDDPKNTLITLNGWLRIVPPDKCAKYKTKRSPRHAAVPRMGSCRAGCPRARTGARPVWSRAGCAGAPG